MKQNRFFRAAAALAVVSSFFVADVAAQAPATATSSTQAKAAAPAAKPPIKLGNINVSGSVRVRLEAYDWFDGAANDSYAFPHAILRLNLGQSKALYDWNLELAAPMYFGAPDDAIAPGSQGQLGLGATYFAANGRERTAASIYPSKFFVRLKRIGNHDANRLTLGRFDFVEGTEVAPKDKTLAALKTMRVAHRMIGNFAFSAAGRSFDGASLSLNSKGGVNTTVMVSRPTRGVFQMNGLGSLDVGVLYGVTTVPVKSASGAGELRVFGIGYTDERPLAKTDNRALAVRTADRAEEVRIGTFGSNYMHVWNSQNAGSVDLLLWAVGQTGSWASQDHRAGAAMAEIGWQPKDVAWKPWLRLGYFIGSGDGDPNDGKHNTFFQMLPTPRWYARYPFYNMQNNTDISATLILRPNAKLSIRSEAHALSLTSRKDLWYQGGGAFQPGTFGYIGRPSGGNRGMGNLWDASVDYQFTPQIGATAYYAHVWGKGVMNSTYPAGKNSQFGYVELNYKF